MESTMGKRQGRSERNDAIVTARVPAEIKKQGNAVLERDRLHADGTCQCGLPVCPRGRAS